MRSLLRRTALATMVLLALASCGGGGGGSAEPPPLTCSLTDQKTWLKSYMDDWYFWYSYIPSINAASYSSIDAYFNALLYDGSNAAFPADRWSYTQSTADFNLFYGDGQTLGYGIFVAGLEVTGHPELPLRVRYIEPLSPAAAAGVVRGDTIVSINGRAASDIISANDYSVLTPANVGDTIHLVLSNGGVQRTLDVSAAVYALKPLSTSGVVSTPLGRRMGYLVLKDFIGQASTPMASAFADFKAAGVSDLVVDLRYNGGGLVSVADQLASYVAGASRQGQVFASLLYNDKHQGSNTSYRFSGTSSDLGINRVFVLAGQRTCSASELVVNGLRPYVNVVLIGDTTCGKPVGFLPQDGGCGTTYSAVNFESVNVNNEGRYWNGFNPTATSTTSCAVADDLDHPLGDPNETLLSVARGYADGAGCPAMGSREQPQSLRVRGARITEPGERQGMIDR
jgi:carboxyl-terminal processing protease